MNLTKGNISMYISGCIWREENNPQFLKLPFIYSIYYIMHI